MFVEGSEEMKKNAKFLRRTGIVLLLNSLSDCVVEGGYPESHHCVHHLVKRGCS